ncbi:hypothetical protein C8R43DRAFT_1242828 [Mycena crocata]|nr:hypothetical protein C8R43DRAFT_1242828 [Mycena crocata]
MHPFLQVGNLSNAPSSYRALARVAVDGGEEAWSSLQALSFRYHNITPGVEPRHLLPVIYSTLDPGTIPNARQMDSAAPLPNFLIHRSDMYLLIVVTMFELHRDPQVAQLMKITPGLRAIIGRAWPMVIDTDNGLQHLGLFGVSELMADVVDPANPANFLELMVGIDGGPVELAKSVVKQLNMFLASPGDYDKYSFLSMSGALQFLKKIEYNPTLCEALLENGVVTVLTALMFKLAPIEEAAPILVICVEAFVDRVQVLPGYPWMEESLQAGLLKVIVRLGSLPSLSAGLSKVVGYLLRDGLPRSLVYYPIVVHLSRTLEDAKVLASTAAFQISPFFHHWHEFVSLADERIRVLREYQSGGHEKLQICNNAQCRNITGKDSTRRYSVCHLGHYCSEHCQRADWHEGNHRDDCAHLYTYRIRESSDPPLAYLTPKNLVRSAYTQYRMSMYLGTMSLMQEFPDKPMYHIFDFCDGRVNMTFQTSTILLAPPVPAKFAAQLRHQMARLEKNCTAGGSVGRNQTELAVVRVAEGPIITARIIAIRYRDLTIPDTLWAVAQTVSPNVLRSRANGTVAASIMHLLDEPLPVFSFASA